MSVNEHGGCKSTRMFEAFKEMIIALEQAIKKYRWKNAQTIKMLEKINEMLKMHNNEQSYDSCYHTVVW